MIIIVYSSTSAETIRTNLGIAEYSYYYVLKEYLPLLRKIGIVITVRTPENEVDQIYHNAKAHGLECIFLSFSPPHKTCYTLQCPTIPIFAWEFSTIPNESWSGQLHQDWTYVLAKLGTAITHSEFLVQIVKETMGQTYPISSIPAPVWNRCEQIQKPIINKTSNVLVPGLFIDSQRIDFTSFCFSKTDETVNPLIYELIHNNKTSMLILSGVVYFSTFNPADGRKNWLDMLDGFVAAHRDHKDSTLVLKLIHHNSGVELRKILGCINSLQPFFCRIVLIGGYLEDEEYLKLAQSAHYVVNSSFGEGQCLPLMELMSMGKPALAPLHSSMHDYINRDNAFIIQSTVEPSIWPEDPRAAFRTLRHRIHWPSVKTAFFESYQTIKGDPDTYYQMSKNAMHTMQHHCSFETIFPRLKQAIETAFVLHRQKEKKKMLTPYEWVIKKKLDTSHPMGLADAKLSGWFNHNQGELVPGFNLSHDDCVINVSGFTACSIFSARVGANTIAITNSENTDQSLEHLSNHQIQILYSKEYEIDLPDSYVSRIVAMDLLGQVNNPEQILTELVRLGKKNALYLFTLSDNDSIYSRTSSLSTNPKIKSSFLKREDFLSLVQQAGLNVISQQDYGFYWTLWFAFYCSTIDADTQDGLYQDKKIPSLAHPLLEQWSKTWSLLLRKEQALKLKTNLDKVLPKTQIIIAIKP